MASKQKTIFVYDDFSSENPILMGHSLCAPPVGKIHFLIEVLTLSVTCQAFLQKK